MSLPGEGTERESRSLHVISGAVQRKCHFPVINPSSWLPLFLRLCRQSWSLRGTIISLTPKLCGCPVLPLEIYIYIIQYSQLPSCITFPLQLLKDNNPFGPASKIRQTWNVKKKKKNKLEILRRALRNDVFFKMFRCFFKPIFFRGLKEKREREESAFYFFGKRIFKKMRKSHRDLYSDISIAGKIFFGRERERNKRGLCKI